MNDRDRRLADLIRRTVPPVGEPPSATDLWPRLERRLVRRRPGAGRLDWLMAVVALGLLAGYPEALILLLYHL